MNGSYEEDTPEEFPGFSSDYARERTKQV